MPPQTEQVDIDAILDSIYGSEDGGMEEVNSSTEEVDIDSILDSIYGKEEEQSLGVPGYLDELGKSVASGFMGTLGSGVEGVGLGMDRLRQMSPIPLPRAPLELLLDPTGGFASSGAPEDESPYTGLGRAVGDAGPDVDPRVSGTLLGQIGSGVGSVGAFLLPGTAGAKVLGGTGALLAAGATGAATEYANAFNDALYRGASLEDAYGAALGSGVLGGASEAIPIASWARRLSRVLANTDRATGGLLKRAMLEGTEEALQEVWQGGVHEAFVREAAGEDWDWKEIGEAASSGGVPGFIVGALVSGGISSMERKKSAQQPIEKGEKAPGAIATGKGAVEDPGAVEVDEAAGKAAKDFAAANKLKDGEYEIVSLPEDEQEIAGSLGLRIVGIKSKKGEPLKGEAQHVRGAVEQKGAKGTPEKRGRGMIVMDAALPREKRMRQVLYHEIGHELRSRDPEAWEKLRAAIPEEALAKLAAERKALQPKASEDLLTEEAVSMRLEDVAPLLDIALRDPQILAQAAGKDRGIIRKLLDALRVVLRKISLRTGQTSIEQAMEKLNNPKASDLQVAIAARDAFDALVVEPQHRPLPISAIRSPVAGLPPAQGGTTETMARMPQDEIARARDEQRQYARRQERKARAEKRTERKAGGVATPEVISARATPADEYEMDIERRTMPAQEPGEFAPPEPGEAPEPSLREKYEAEPGKLKQVFVGDTIKLHGRKGKVVEAQGSGRAQRGMIEYAEGDSDPFTMREGAVEIVHQPRGAQVKRELSPTLQERRARATQERREGAEPRFSLRRTISVDGIQRPTENSLGKPIHSTEEGIRKFWRWFGESHVVDKQGRPRVVYHGTRKTFDSFDPAALGSYTGAASAHLGFFFSSSPTVAASYPDGLHEVESRDRQTFGGGGYMPVSLAYRLPQAEADLERANASSYEVVDSEEEADKFEVRVTTYSQFGDEHTHDLGYIYDTRAEADDAGQAEINEIVSAATARVEKFQKKADEEREEAATGARLIPVYLSIQNPNEHNFRGGSWEDQSFSELLEDAIKDEQDGVMMLRVSDSAIGDEESDVYVALSPTQIKSATGNLGTFDPKNPDIRYSIRRDDDYVPPYAIPTSSKRALNVMDRAGEDFVREVRSMKVVNADVDKALADPKYAADIEERLLDGEVLEGFETVAAAKIVVQAAERASYSGHNSAAGKRAHRLSHAFYAMRSEQGFSLQAVKALNRALMTRKERVLALMTVPTRRVRRRIKRLTRALRTAKGEARYSIRRELDALAAEEAKRTAKVLARLKAKGIDINTANLSDTASFGRTAGAVEGARSQFWDWYIEYFYTSMLSMPVTHARNIVGSGTNLVYRGAAVRFAKAMANISGSDPNLPTLGEVGVWMQAIVEHLPRAGRAFIETLTTEVPFFEEEMRGRGVETVMGDKIEGDQDAEQITGGKIPGKTGKVLRLPGVTLLKAADEAFKTLAADAEAIALAYRKAKGDPVKMQAYLNNPEILQESYGVGRETTFQNRDGKGLAQLVLSARSWADKKAFGAPVGTQLVPFVATPIEIAKTALRVPGMAAVIAYRAKQGEYGLGGKHNLKGDVAEAVLGLLVTAAIIEMAGWRDDEGRYIVTGSGGSSPDERALKSRTEPATSFQNTSGEYMSYGHIEPYATTVATIMDVVRKSDDPFDAMRGFMDQMSDKTFLRTIGDIYKGITDPEGPTAARIVKSTLISPMVPNLIRGGLRSEDDNMRDVHMSRQNTGRDFMETVPYDLLPSKDTQLPVKYDTWGREIERAGRSWPTRFVWPVLTTLDDAPIRADLAIRNYNDGAEKALYIAEPDRVFERRGVKYELTKEQYARYCKESGEIALRRVNALNFDYKKPRQEDVQRIKDAVYGARSVVRNKILREMQQPVSR